MSFKTNAKLGWMDTYVCNSWYLTIDTSVSHWNSIQEQKRKYRITIFGKFYVEKIFSETFDISYL